MSNVQIWNGSTWIDFYTLPNATSSTLGGVKIGNNITVSNGTISLTKSNVTSALGYTPLSLSGGTMTGAISYQGTKATYSMIRWIDNTADTYGNGIRIGGGGATIIGGGESADLPNVSGGDEILYLMNDGNIDFYSNCQSGLSSAKHMTFDTSGNLNVPTDVKASGNIYEGGTALSSKYLGINTKEVVKTSGTQDVGGDKTFNGQTTIDNLILTTISGAPTINVYNTKNVNGYLVTLPYNNGLDCTIASTGDLPTAGTGLSLSNGAFSVKTGYATNGKNYKVEADNSGNLYVKVPWTDTNTDTHYINYLQIKGNGTEAVKFTQKENTSLNLKPGNNVSISAASGEITISATDTTYSAATQSAAGLMSSTDKTKLNGIATGATKVTTDTVSGWGYTKNTGTVTQVKVGTTAYSPSSGVISLPAYPSIPTSLKNPNSITIKAGNDTVSSYDGSAAKTFTFAASTKAGAFIVSDGTTSKTIQLAGQFTDNNSWRPVVDNLTSTDTDKSLSANQGKVLKGLVDGKAASNHNHDSKYLPLSGGTIDGFLTITQKTDGTPLTLYYNNENDYFLKIYPHPNDYTNVYKIDAYNNEAGEVALSLPSKSGIFALTSDIPKALKNPKALKFGSKTYDGSSDQTITLSDLGGGGGMTCAQVFEGAGDISGQYHQAGSWSTKINIVHLGYKLLVFYVNVADVEFPFCAYVPSSRFSYTIYCMCANQNGNLAVIQIVYNDSSFTASVASGNGPLYNVNIYAYK